MYFFLKNLSKTPHFPSKNKNFMPQKRQFFVEEGEKMNKIFPKSLFDFQCFSLQKRLIRQFL